MIPSKKTPKGRTPFVLSAVGLLVFAAGCQQAVTQTQSDKVGPGEAASGPNPTGPAQDENASVPKQTLPDLTLRDDTPDVLLTWVGEEGDFHVAEAVSEIPEARRSQVRVVRTTEQAGTGATVYVADVSQARSDGTYPVLTMARSQWDAVGAQLRKARMEEFSLQAKKRQQLEAKQLADGPALSATIYGADWCKPCHQAEDYLKSLGVKVTKKNIEKSRAAQAEMRDKLSKIHRDGAGIPVIDLMGRVFVGFSPGHLKQAVVAARKRTAKSG